MRLWRRGRERARPEATVEELAAPTILGRSVWLSDLALDNGEQVPLIDAKTFIDCDIFGPVVLAPRARNTWYRPRGDGADVVTVVDRDGALSIIGIRDCTFQDCRMHMLGLVGK